MNVYEASRKISENNSVISDKIINVIELNKERISGNELYEAAISQKSEKIRWFNFNRAVSLKRLKRTGLRSVSIIGVLGLILWIWPDFIRTGYSRVIKLENFEESELTINFKILNDSLKVEAGKDFILKFEAGGRDYIGEAGLFIGGKNLKADKIDGSLEFTFKAVNNPVAFRLYAGKIRSQAFRLEVMHKPEISNIRITVIPPSYTGLSAIESEGDGNIEIPAGSRIVWNFRTVFTDEMFFCMQDTTGLRVEGNTAEKEGTFYRDQDYSVKCVNKDGLSTEYFYRVSTVKDLFPEIEISERIDSLNKSVVFVEGSIQDDYGFNKLELITENDKKEEIELIEINKEQIYQLFYSEIIPDTTAKSYFFRIWDNDKNGGPKFTESRKILLKKKTRDELAAENTVKAEKVADGMEESISSVEELEDKIMKFRMERLSGSLKPWEVQERVKEINDMKDILLKMIEGFQQENAEYTDNEQLLEQEQEIADKAREIEQLLENLIDDELKQLLEEFQKLEKEYKEQEANELSEKLEINMEKLKEQMEMGLELLRKFELEKEILRDAKELEKMAEEINTGTLNDSITSKVLDDFKKWEEKFENSLKKNQEFSKPLSLEDLASERKSTRDSLNTMNEAKEAGKKEAGKKASSRLKKLSREVSSMLQSGGEEDKVVDIEEIRQIRNALNDFSKVQEELNGRMGSVNLISPVASDLIREQKILESKFDKIRDSLKSLGYKQPMIAAMLGEEMFHVETSMRSIFQSFSTGRMPTVRIEQNRIMSNANILVLKLDEIIKSTENQKGSGSGKNSFTDSKKKSKGEQQGSEEISETRSQQESLKQQLKGAIQQMKQGKGSKQGRKELSQMLGEREMMRKAAERLSQGGMLGKDAKERLMQALEMMKEVEKDIIYDRMGDHTIEKDEWIRTRLLEAENAERERENENRRESKEFKGEFAPNELLINPTPQQNKPYRQTLKYRDLKLKKYYQEKYDQYIQSTRKR
ncbi:MAG TPA: hypothetical protein DC042_04225 [Bacteroidales bacterium]|nr:hypothetical protein [Bacteroidales bacterium]